MNFILCLGIIIRFSPTNLCKCFTKSSLSKIFSGFPIHHFILDIWFNTDFHNRFFKPLVLVDANKNLTCGTILAAYEKEKENKDYEHLDKLIVWDMRNYKPGKYKKGKIWDPSKDKIYKSKMEVSGNNLLVSGCILVLCREQTWIGLP